MAFKGPFDPEISPDGRRVAYTYYWQYTGYDPYCNVTNDCTVKRLYHGTGFTDPNRLTAWDEPGFLRRSGWIDASWVDNSTVLLSNPYIQPNEDTVLWSPGRQGLAQALVPGSRVLRRDIDDATISRDKSALATVTENGGPSSSTIVDRSAGSSRTTPSAATWPRGDRISSPTISADGSRVFWATASRGIHTVALPRLGAKTCPPLTDGDKVLIAGASNPSWGPADVPPARPAAAAARSRPAARSSRAAVKTPTTPGATIKLTVSKAKLAAALKKGLTLKLTGARSGKHALTAKYGKTTVAKGTVTVKNGSGKATLRFSTAGKRKLKGRKTAALTITGAGARATVMLKR